MKRVFLIVLDSFGIGNAPDADKFGDYGANTLKSISKSPLFKIDTLTSLGIGNIDGVECICKATAPLAAHARMIEQSAGKDTTVGHWEIAGLVSSSPLPTYPNGFPKEIIGKFKAETGCDVICNLPYSGTQVLDDFGKEHLESGKLIIYTSADSVFQIAAHTDIVSLEDLYSYCRIARRILQGEHSVGRVIARPFNGTVGNFKRTSDRRDFSLEPYGTTLLDNIVASGKEVIAVGKISDIFAGKGITKKIPTHNNDEGMAVAQRMLDLDFTGLCFINLVDFDMLYGHRNNTDGYAHAATEFDKWLSGFIKSLGENDCLFITADHGCDPGDVSTDHTRECTPLLVYGKNILPKNLGTRNTFADISATVADMLDISYTCHGQSFYNDIKKEDL